MFNLLIIYGSYSHLSSAHDSVRKYLGIPNCLIILHHMKTVSSMLTCLWLNSEMKIHCPLQQTFLNCFFKITLTVPAVSVLGLILCIARFIDECKCCCSYTTGKKYIICIRCKVPIKVQQPLIKVPNRTYWNISRSFISKYTLRKKIRKCLLFKKLLPKIETGFFTCPGAI